MTWSRETERPNGNQCRCQSRGIKHVLHKCFHTRRPGKTTRKRPCSSELTHLKITSEEVKQLNGKLKTSKSPGPVQLYPRVLVELTYQLIEPRKTIVCRSLIEGQLPQDWKDCNITQLNCQERCKRHIPGDYRPVNLTWILCKMLERLARSAIMEHVESNNLLNDVQNGFVGLPGRSCSTQLLTVLDEWTSALENGDNLDAFIQAFDTHCPTSEAPSKAERLRYLWNCATVDRSIPLSPSPERCSKSK